MPNPVTPPQRAERRAARALGWTLLVYAALVSTHEGEFWPFSIYPMFSRAGQPWHRVVAREVAPDAPVAWAAVHSDSLPGRPFGLMTRGVEPIDLADLINKTDRWTPARINALRRLLHTEREHRLIIVRADGELTDDEVVVGYRPFALVHRDTVRLHPDLPR